MAEELALLVWWRFVQAGDAAAPAPAPPQIACMPCRPRSRDSRQERKAAKARMRELRDGDRSALTAAGMCAHWMPGKSRFCNFPPPAGLKFCRHHDPGLVGDLERVPCPVDGGHTVLKSMLAQHVRVCSAKKDADRTRSMPWYRAGVNGGGAGGLGDSRAAARPTRQLLDALDAWAEAQADDAECGSRVARDAPATKKQRHSIQGDLIVEAAAATAPALFSSRAAVVDLGAGKGGLASRVRAAWPGDAVVCVEREARRQKKDGAMRDVGAFARVRADLADVDLSKVDELGSGPVVGVAKHLCGVASDLALKALDQLPRGKWRGLALATCCHHRCDWTDYVGRDHFAAALRGGNALEFALIARWAAWATMADPNDAKQRSDANKSGHDAPPKTVPGADPVLDALDWRRKRDVGRRCKQLIDAGRIDFLKHRGLANVARVKYCPTCLSPENNLIVADLAADAAEPQRPPDPAPDGDDADPPEQAGWCHSVPHCACA